MSRPYVKGAMDTPLRPLARVATWPFVVLIRVYRVALSPIIGGSCRFEPTCSCYGLEAYRLHGPIRGTWLTARRVLRCHPLGGGGYDPVPLPVEGGAAHEGDATRLGTGADAGGPEPAARTAGEGGRS